MTREEAIAILIREIDEDPFMRTEHRELIHGALNMAINALKQPRWIPVSERLPKTNDDVLVYDGADMYVAWYQIKGMCQGWNSHDNSFERDTPIVAWMPLPEPYRAESEE